MRQMAGYSYWTGRTTPVRQYPWLAVDERCEILVIGGGATGALLGYRFAEDGNDVCLLTKLPVGYGVTAFGSGILEYDGNLSLVQLGKSIGRGEAVDCLRRYRDALDSVEALCLNLEPEVDFRRRDILSYTSDENHGDFFNTEYLIRRHNSFEVEYLDRAATRDRYSFPIEDGILSERLGAEIDPYRFTQSLVDRAVKKYGMRCYENTEVVSIGRSNGKIAAKTATGQTICADKLIFAAGLEQSDYIKCYTGRRTAFTVVTEPISRFVGYESRVLVRNDDGSGFHLRTTPDNRLLITGSDSLFPEPADRRFSKLTGYERIAESRYERLTKRLREMFCGIERIVPAYCYAVRYGYTADLLPVIGETPDYENVYFCMESGSENILTAEIAADLLMRKYHGEAMGITTFSPSRKSLVKRFAFME